MQVIKDLLPSAKPQKKKKSPFSFQSGGQGEEGWEELGSAAGEWQGMKTGHSHRAERVKFDKSKD